MLARSSFSILRDIYSKTTNITDLAAAKEIDFSQSQDLEVYIAAKSERGDILFNTSAYRPVWVNETFILPAGGNVAYQLNSLGKMSKGITAFGLTVGDDAGTRNEVARFDYEDGKGILTLESEKISFTALSDKEKAKLVSDLQNNVILCAGLTETRGLVYAYQTQSGDYLLVSSSANAHSSGNYQMFTGPLENLREIEVLNVNRYRDGGTTSVSTAEGELFVRSPARGGGASWQGQELKEMDKKELSNNLGKKFPKIQGVAPFVPA